ncbi:MAG: extracellular solute-binding protein [Armatimonadetes bacterium]|nr:extracellular solute-binding protein [Armatimonadota bacterium]
MRTCLRLLTLVLGATLVAPLQAQGEKQIDLIVWGHQIGPEDKGLDDVVRRFEELHPNIHVKMLGMGAGRMNPQKLMTSIVGEVPPDVIFQDRFAVPDWSHLGAFEPLDWLIERDRATDPNTPVPENYYVAPWAEGMYKGKLYAIPWMADTRVLYWNRDAFAERADDLRAAGLDPTSAPQTWSETLAYSRVLTEFDDNGQLVRAGFIPNFGNSWLYMYAFQNNASFMSADGTECTLNTPESLEALQFMIDGYEILGGIEKVDLFLASLRGEENDPFFKGQIAMKIDGDWILPSIARYAPRLNFAVAEPPVPDDRFYKRGRFKDEEDTFITWAGGFSYAIPKGARNLDAAWEFIKFRCSPEMRMLEMVSYGKLQRERGRLYVPRPHAEISTNLLAIERLMPVAGNLRDASELHISMLGVARFRPSTFAGQRLWDEHVRAMDRALRGTLTPEEALQSGEDRVQKYLDDVLGRDQLPLADLRIPVVIGLVGFIFGSVLIVGWWKRQKLGRLARHEAIWGYIFAAPWIIGFVVFTLGPMAASLYMSFTSYNVFSAPRWVGMQNYSDLFVADAELLWKALFNVLYLGGVGVPLGIITGLAIAMMLNTGVRGLRYYRTIYYMPSVVPLIASIILWLWILDPDPSRGILNALWENTITEWFGTRPPGWLAVESWAKPALITMGLWGAGGGMILWLAGLKGISRQLYEAASIDGATAWQGFWAITIPQLSPLIFFNVIMGSIGVLQTFDQIYVAVNGEGAGPNDSLLVPVYFLFREAFYYFRLGYASALAWLIFAIVMVITLIQFKVAPRWVHYEVDK